jgi:LuxR family maltose regulon positive regulatory protein
MSLLITKNHVPILTQNLITRPRLYSRLDAVLQPGQKLAVISAPAGFGKTTFISQWLRNIPDIYRVGWYSLDENDNTLTRFFSYLVSALRRADPSIGVGFMDMVETHPELKSEELISYTINQIIESSSNFLLIVDDIHFITNPEIFHALSNLIDHLPSNMRLVISGRVDPSLPMARWRARGQLVEIRTSDLRFNNEETGIFVKQSKVLSSTDNSIIDALSKSTEGWAAGLQMTLLAFHSEFQAKGGEPGKILDWIVNELNGSHRFILDYLLEEVLNRVSSNVREFLLRTSVLERFDAELCASVCAPETSVTLAQMMLEDLERANLFIIPLDSQRKWYRYHHLFADMLKKQFLHTYPGLESELHRLAANWFEQHQLLDEAINHAQQTNDEGFLQELVEKHALGNIMRGQITSSVQWLNSLPIGWLNSSPRLCLDRAWALTFTSQTEAAREFLERAETLLWNRSEKSDPIKCEIFGLQSYQKGIYGEVEDAMELAQLARAHAPETDQFLQCSSRMFYAIALIRNGKIDEAMDEYHFIQSTCQDERGLSGLALLEADFLQFAAVLLYLRHDIKKAIQLLKDAIQTFEQYSNGYRKTATLYLYVGLGKILYTSNQLEEAESVLNRGLRIDSLSFSFAAIDGWTTLWWVKIGQRNYSAARSIINNLESTTLHCDDKIRRLVILPGALQDLLEGKNDSALKRVEKLGFTDDVEITLANISDTELMGWRVNEFFVYARTLVAQGKPQQGLRVLDRMAQAAQKKGMDLVLCRMWLNQAIIYLNDHQDKVAMEIMERLLNKTSRLVFGAIHIYLSTGDPARNILLKALKQGLQPEHVTSLLAAFPSQANSELIPDSPETLSEREVEVLRLLAEGMKNQEIADRLVVSLNTVRYHTKNIFGKLGVDNRTAAVARGRELSLFE